MYTEKMDQITDTSKKRKIILLAQQNLKERPIGFVIKLRLILTKHKQLCTIVIIPRYHQPMLL